MNPPSRSQAIGRKGSAWSLAFAATGLAVCTALLALNVFVSVNYAGGHSPDLWLAVLLLGWGTLRFGFMVWRHANAFVDRRRERDRLLAGLCLHCGYSLAGNMTGVCPECGMARRRLPPDDGV